MNLSYKKNYKKQLIILFSAVIIMCFFIQPGYATALRNYIADTVLDGFIAWIFDKYNTTVNALLNFVFDKFRPDVQTFIEYTGDATVILEVFEIFGYTLAVLIFTYMMIITATKALNLSDTKDTPLRLIAMLSIALFCIYFHEFLEDIVFGITNEAWDFLLYTDNATVSLAQNIAQIAVPDDLVDGLLAVPDKILGLLLTLIFGIIFYIQFLKFCIEIIERYLVACFLKYLFPLTVATITSKNSIQVFKKYFQMLICQLLLLLFNLIFVKILINMTAVVMLTNSLTSWLVLFGMMKVAQRMDWYMRSMGLGVAITGGGLVDALGMSGRSLINLGRAAQLGGGLGGSALTRLGAASGNLGMLRAGNALNNLAHPIRSASDRHGMSQVLNTAKKRGDIDSVASQLRPGDIDNSMIDLARSRGMDCLDLNGMPLDTKTALMERAYGSSIMPGDGAYTDIWWNKFGDIGGEITDGNGNKAAFKLSPVPDNNAIRTISTENGELYLTARGGLAPGQSCAYSYDRQNAEQLSFAECISGKSFESLGDSRGSVEYVMGGEDGNVLLKGSNGENLANIDKKGNWDYNVSSIDLNEDNLKGLSQFSGFSGLAVQNNGNGTYTVLGERIVSTGANGSTTHIEEFTLYNRAVYPSKESVPISSNSRYVTGFGKNDIEHGSYHVYQNKHKDDEQLRVRFDKMKNRV